MFSLLSITCLAWRPVEHSPLSNDHRRHKLRSDAFHVFCKAVVMGLLEYPVGGFMMIPLRRAATDLFSEVPLAG